MIMSHPSVKAKGKGKQPKRFLDQTAALGLAESIADKQEQKSHIKAEKHQLAQIGQSRPERSPQISESKAKLVIIRPPLAISVQLNWVTQKQTKALIAAQRFELKKARNKRRKNLKQSTSVPNGDASSTLPEKKRVSFA
ncbi:hypothetical protein B0H13DRAFT_769629 [Mycena leptocephala]|nr:hypothetical protein B0H13DRAFT_769629 [Mycena leptocephala]